MIEIKTQAEFDSLSNIITKFPAETGGLIRIHALENGQPYELRNTLVISQHNITIEGYGAYKPKIVPDQNFTPYTLVEAMIYLRGTSSSILHGVTIKNIEISDEYKLGGTASNIEYGIRCEYVGKSYSAGLSSGTYSRYDSTTCSHNLENQKGVTIKNCKIITYKSNLSMVYCDNSTICNNSLSSKTMSGRHKFLMASCKSNIIDNNLFKFGEAGMFNQSSCYNNIIANNTFANNRTGLGIYSNSDNNIVSDNIIKDNSVTGINVYNSNNNIISDNLIHSNPQAINLTLVCNQNIVTSNNLFNNSDKAIVLHDVDYDIVCNNNISGSPCGIELSAGCTFQNITNNNLVGNPIPVTIDSESNHIILYGNKSNNLYNIQSTNNIFKEYNY